MSTLTVQEVQDAWVKTKVAQEGFRHGFRQMLLAIMQEMTSVDDFETIMKKYVKANRQLFRRHSLELKAFWRKHQSMIKAWIFDKSMPEPLTGYYAEEIREAMNGKAARRQGECIILPRSILSSPFFDREFDDCMGIVGPSFKVILGPGDPAIEILCSFCSKNVLTMQGRISVDSLTEARAHRIIEGFSSKARILQHGISPLDRVPDDELLFYIDWRVTPADIPGLTDLETEDTPYFVGDKRFRPYLLDLLKGIFPKCPELALTSDFDEEHADDPKAKQLLVERLERVDGIYL